MFLKTFRLLAYHTFSEFFMPFVKTIIGRWVYVFFVQQHGFLKYVETVKGCCCQFKALIWRCTLTYLTDMFWYLFEVELRGRPKNNAIELLPLKYLLNCLLLLFSVQLCMKCRTNIKNLFFDTVSPRVLKSVVVACAEACCTKFDVRSD